jgi:hypothetical protein
LLDGGLVGKVFEVRYRLNVDFGCRADDLQHLTVEVVELCEWITSVQLVPISPGICRISNLSRHMKTHQWQ